MKCPLCNRTEDKVIESRLNQSGTTIRRRRECAECGYRFTSYEHIEEISLVIIKRSGKRENFEAEKIRQSILTVLDNKSIKKTDMEQLLTDIESDAALESRSTQEMRSVILCKLIMKRLFALDQVAFVRFAAIYGDYSGVEDFLHILDEVSVHGIQKDEEIKTGEQITGDLFLTQDL